MIYISIKGIGRIVLDKILIRGLKYSKSTFICFYARPLALLYIFLSSHSCSYLGLMKGHQAIKSVNRVMQRYFDYVTFCIFNNIYQ